jgi:glycerophosphoryl diester phosphodiesterase
MSRASPRPNGFRPRTIREFLEMDTPGVIAHRGLSGLAPENTMAAFRRALDIGVDMIELDVLLSADDQLVVFHDETLDRTTDGSGPVRERNLAQLKRLDAGGWFAGEFVREPIPILLEVLELVGDRTLLNVEIKDEAVTDQVEGGITHRVIRLLRDHGFGDRVLLSSFDSRALLHARELDPDIPRGLLFNPRSHSITSPIEILEDTGAASLNLSSDQVNETIVARCHQMRRAVLVYTVNEVEEMRRMISMGVDGLFTDRADVMLELIR